MTGGTNQVPHSPPLYHDQGATIISCGSQETAAPPSYEEAINPNGRLPNGVFSNLHYYIFSTTAFV